MASVTGNDLKRLEDLIIAIATSTNEIKADLKTVEKRLSALEVGQAELKGDIKALDTKIDGIGKRLENQEFISRGVLIALIVAIVGGFAKLFGVVGNP